MGTTPEDSSKGDPPAPSSGSSEDWNRRMETKKICPEDGATCGMPPSATGMPLSYLIQCLFRLIQWITTGFDNFGGNSVVISGHPVALCAVPLD
uniref:Uncharacterized protein n=1 Tax=Ditylenchus dipsaci TaxID=166011 RepID=A0A915D002_9BILA